MTGHICRKVRRARRCSEDGEQSEVGAERRVRCKGVQKTEFDQELLILVWVVIVERFRSCGFRVKRLEAMLGLFTPASLHCYLSEKLQNRP